MDLVYLRLLTPAGALVHFPSGVLTVEVSAVYAVQIIGPPITCLLQRESRICDALWHSLNELNYKLDLYVVA